MIKWRKTNHYRNRGMCQWVVVTEIERRTVWVRLIYSRSDRLIWKVRVKYLSLILLIDWEVRTKVLENRMIVR